MSEDPIITEEMESRLNEDFGPEVYEIERGMVRKFAEAIEDPNPKWNDIAPPTFAAALVPTQLMNFVFNVKCPLTRVLNGGSELEYFIPIKVGDVISVTARLERLRKMEGKEGKTLFMISGVTYTNQHGETVARGRNTLIRY